MAQPIVLIREKNTKKYIDHYVAQASFGGGKVIAFDKDPAEAYKKAVEKGCKDPIIFYVPDPKIPHLYRSADYHSLN